MDEPVVRFGVFEFSPATGALRRDGRIVPLQTQPAKLLAALVARPGEVVSRERLQQEIWTDGTHVDFERGLNFCVSQVRSALRDSAEGPRYVETVPRQGYRFIAPVSVVVAAAPDVGGSVLRPQPVGRSMRAAWVVASLLAIVAMAALVPLVAGRQGASSGAAAPVVVVVPFYNETGRPELAPVAAAIGDATVARLAAPERIGTVSVIGNAAALRRPFAREDVQAIARQLGAEWVVIGQLKADGQGLRVIGHLIRANDMKHVWANTFDRPTFTLDVQASVAESIAQAVSHAVSTR